MNWVIIDSGNGVFAYSSTCFQSDPRSTKILNEHNAFDNAVWKEFIVFLTFCSDLNMLIISNMSLLIIWHDITLTRSSKIFWYCKCYGCFCTIPAYLMNLTDLQGYDQLSEPVFYALVLITFTLDHKIYMYKLALSGTECSVTSVHTCGTLVLCLTRSLTNMILTFKWSQQVIFSHC